MPPTVAQSWRTIEEVLRENAHSVFRALRKPAPAETIAGLDAAVPAELPRDFVQSLKVHDGLRASCGGLFDGYVLLPARDILKTYRMQVELQAECGFPGDAAGDPSIKNDARWRPGWIPVLDSNGDAIILDIDPTPSGNAGQLFEWSNYGHFPPRLLAASFGEWLAGLAERLSRRHFRLDEFGGIAFWMGDDGSA